jgi:hypothetical protein
MQYTIRGIPPSLDQALRKRAKTTGKSLNETAVEALIEGSGVSGVSRKRRDLSDIVGTWVEDPAFDEAIADQQRIDEDMWK